MYITVLFGFVGNIFSFNVGCVPIFHGTKHKNFTLFTQNKMIPPKRLVVLSTLCMVGTDAFFLGKSPVSSMPKVTSMPDLEKKDDDGILLRTPRKKIERDWTFDGFESSGEMTVDFFLPEDGNVKGCAFFMHGFSQYPEAYCSTLKKAADKASVAILAVETGISSSFVLKEALKNRSDAQLVLQRAVSQDTNQCIKMVLEGNDIFKEYGITKQRIQKRIGVMGHSMGGGLSFPVAAGDYCKEIDYVFTMAPAYGVEEFNPIEKGVKIHTASNSMLLAGSWDLIAPAKKVKNISEVSNEKQKDSSIFVDVKRGTHTGFQDRVTLFSIPLLPGLEVTSVVLNLLGIVDSFIFSAFDLLQLFLVGLRLNKRRTGQLAGTRILMDYFLKSMVDRKKLTLEDAEKYLDDNLNDKYDKNFDFSFPAEPEK